MLLHSRRKMLPVTDLLRGFHSSLAVGVVAVAVVLQGPHGETTSPCQRRTIAIQEKER